jgi:ABC-type transport system involved in cytochrome c biogenesis permease subunit
MTSLAFLLGQTETLLFLLQLAFLLACLAVVAIARAGKGAAILAMAALASGLASALVRSLGAGRPPFASTYEFGLLLCLVLDGLLVFVSLRYRERAFSLAAAIAAFVMGSVVLLLFEAARPLVPALKSLWLGAHVLTAVIAYACLALAAALAVAGLAAGKDVERAGRLEAFANRLVAIAFPFLTLLIITGAIWAEYAWGSFWRWDPKETWALVTWLVYLAYLHLVRSRGWKGRKALILCLCGFGVVLFTFFGVNFLLAGLHSYR